MSSLSLGYISCYTPAPSHAKSSARYAPSSDHSPALYHSATFPVFCWWYNSCYVSCYISCYIFCSFPWPWVSWHHYPNCHIAACEGTGPVSMTLHHIATKANIRADALPSSELSGTKITRDNSIHKKKVSLTECPFQEYLVPSSYIIQCWIQFVPHTTDPILLQISMTRTSKASQGFRYGNHSYYHQIGRIGIGITSKFKIFKPVQAKQNTHFIDFQIANEIDSKRKEWT